MLVLLAEKFQTKPNKMWQRMMEYSNQVADQNKESWKDKHDSNHCQLRTELLFEWTIDWTSLEHSLFFTVKQAKWSKLLCAAGIIISPILFCIEWMKNTCKGLTLTLKNKLIKCWWSVSMAITDGYRQQDNATCPAAGIAQKKFKKH